MKKRCVNRCSVVFQEEDRYCWCCGTELIEDDLKCECGNELSVMDKFCGKCGRAVPKGGGVDG